MRNVSQSFLKVNSQNHGNKQEKMRFDLDISLLNFFKLSSFTAAGGY